MQSVNGAKVSNITALFLSSPCLAAVLSTNPVTVTLPLKGIYT